MSLSALAVETSDFLVIYQHVLTFKPKYRNMHMREARQVSGRRDLRYLHMMKANSSLPEIEGVISGAEIFCHYKLRQVGGRVQVNVISERGSAKEKARLARRFTVEVLRRVDFEKQGFI